MLQTHSLHAGGWMVEKTGNGNEVAILDSRKKTGIGNEVAILDSRG